MPITEPEAMQIAFDALKGLDHDTENSVLVWLKHRLREHRRGKEASAYKGPAPTEWQFHYPEDDETGSYDTRDEGLYEAGENTPNWRIIEVTAHAAVHHEFIVVIPWSEPDGGSDREYRSFPTRAEAEKCVEEGKAYFAKNAEPEQD